MAKIKMPANVIETGIKEAGKLAANLGSNGASVIETGVKETGKLVASFGDNKTKRYVSDNQTDIGHHELNNQRIEIMVKGIAKGLQSLVAAFEINRKTNAEIEKIEKDRATRHEEQENRRREIENELETARMTFEQAAGDRASRVENYRYECDRIDRIWHEMFEYFKANPDDTDRSELLRQMGDVRHQATELAKELISGESGR